MMRVRWTRIWKPPLWADVEVEVQVVEEEGGAEEEMEANLLPEEAKMNQEPKEVGEAEVVAGKGKVEGEEGQRPIGGTKPNKLRRRKRRKEAVKGLASQLSAASGAFCRVDSQAGEVGELEEGKMDAEAALQAG